VSENDQPVNHPMLAAETQTDVAPVCLRSMQFQFLVGRVRLDREHPSTSRRPLLPKRSGSGVKFVAIPAAKSFSPHFIYVALLVTPLPWRLPEGAKQKPVAEQRV
jgi:hypothetical protein